jgi:hypothetical protein
VKAQTTPSLVGTTTSSYATYYPFQRKNFYTNGRFWVFYSDGTNMVYRTSTDGSTWSAATTVRACSYGYQFSVWFDGTYLHYVYASSSGLYYRRGTPNADGAITWSAIEQSISLIYGYAYRPFISVDSNGYPWIVYYSYSSSPYPLLALKSSKNDGTWATESTTTLTVATSGNTMCGAIVPLTSGKMLALYTNDGAAVSAKYWSGSAWGTAVSTTSTVQSAYEFSAVAQGDNVHLVFLKYSTYNIIYVKYTYSTNSFGTETTLVSGATSSSSPVISINTATNNLYVFAATITTGTPSGWTANHIYYCIYNASTSTWGSWTSWIDESSTGTNELLYSAYTLTCSYQAYDNIGLEYLTKTSSPYNVKFAYLPAVVRQWRSVSTFLFSLQTRAWRNIVSWSFSLLTRTWRDIASWSFSLLTETWHDAACWSFNLATMIWNTVTYWTVGLGEHVGLSVGIIAGLLLGLLFAIILILAFS